MNTGNLTLSINLTLNHFMQDSAIDIYTVYTLDQMMQNYHLIVQLTPSLTIAMYQHYLQEMIPHRYAQIIAKKGDDIVGVSGFWIATKLYCGKYLEIDNLIVDAKHRSQQIGHLLVKQLEIIAKQNDCQVMMLDAYLTNTEAHRFYQENDFKAKGYHFIKKTLTIPINHECLRDEGSLTNLDEALK
ncbi:MAG: GNAT family N-acetyltransferase [Bacteroidetes bacterium]|nr:GNAT family N-acetyltransferase [Bacteroidota bacterium]